MSTGVAKSQCSIHASRPATARCPSCRRFYCAECVTEHSGRFVCAACLAAATSERKRARPGLAFLHPAPWLQLGVALVVVWAAFYLFARFLGDIPDAFHDGTIWE